MMKYSPLLLLLLLSCTSCNAVLPSETNEARPEVVQSYPDLEYYQSILKSDDPSPLPIQEDHYDFDLSRLDEALGDSCIAHPLYLDRSKSAMNQSSQPIGASHHLNYNLDNPSAELLQKPHETSVLDSYAISSIEAIDPNDSFPDYSSSAIDEMTTGIESTEEQRKGNTSYWKSLKDFPRSRTAIVDKYCSMTYINGKPISRGVAIRRLAKRCTEKVSMDLLSSDPLKVRMAKDHIDGGAKRFRSDLTQSERTILREIIMQNCRVRKGAAARMMLKGFRELSSNIKMEFIEGKKDAKAYSAFARKLEKAYLRQDTREYRQKVGLPAIEENSSDDEGEVQQQKSHNEVGFANPSKQEYSPNFWMSLSEEQQKYISQKYMTLIGSDMTFAWNKLYAQCTPNVAIALLSEVKEAHEFAIAVLAKVYKNGSDILSEEEKERLFEQLERLHHIKGRSLSRCLTLGQAYLDEEIKMMIKEDLRMDDARFEEMANIMWDNSKAVDKGKYYVAKMEKRKHKRLVSNASSLNT